MQRTEITKNTIKGYTSLQPEPKAAKEADHSRKRKASIGRSTYSRVSKKPCWENGRPKELDYFQSKEPPQSLPGDETGVLPDEEIEGGFINTVSRDGECIVSQKRGARSGCYIVSPEISDKRYPKEHIKDCWEVAECLFGHDGELFARVKEALSSPREAYGWDNPFYADCGTARTLAFVPLA